MGFGMVGAEKRIEPSVAQDNMWLENVYNGLGADQANGTPVFLSYGVQSSHVVHSLVALVGGAQVAILLGVVDDPGAGAKIANATFGRVKVMGEITVTGLKSETRTAGHAMRVKAGVLESLGAVFAHGPTEVAIVRDTNTVANTSAVLFLLGPLVAGTKTNVA